MFVMTNLNDIILFPGTLAELNALGVGTYKIMVDRQPGFLRTDFYSTLAPLSSIQELGTADNALRKMVQDLGGNGVIHYLPIVVGTGTGMSHFAPVKPNYAAQGVPVRRVDVHDIR